ncbi:MAG: TIGR03936 family radical SAM-associated protein [Thermoanaerobacteraceae bacterium]|nr:TIGR03936 family radical SAM-associated protein [Thermoanaerobacteraceae bacterium]
MDRIRVKYTKGKEVRYISHLDIIRALERALRRADIPFALTEGFNPKPRMNFSPPLSLGYISCAEYFDLDMSKSITPEKFMERMNLVLPSGMMIVDAVLINPKSKSLNSIINSAEYEINYPFKKDILFEIDRFLKDEIVIEKKTKKGTKSIGIRTLIYEFSVRDDKNIKLWLASSPSESINPMYVLKAYLDFNGVEFKETDVFITRIEQYIDREKNTPMLVGVN